MAAIRLAALRRRVRPLSPSLLPPPAGWSEAEVLELADRFEVSPEEAERAVACGRFGWRRGR